MSIRVFFALLIGKAVRLFCRVMRRGGTAKPGEFALKICPDLLKVLSRNVKCIVITGTNGKTTCTRIVEEGLRQAGYTCFANRSGANLIEGIATDFIVNSGLNGKCRYGWAVLETDEAASKRVCLQLQPEVILVTNLFRDQVDRFGGVVNTRDSIRIGIQNAPKAVLVLNADCPVTASLADDVPNPAVFYGFSEAAADRSTGKGVNDFPNCIHCKHPYSYDYIVYSHLGKYRCEACGSTRPAVKYEVTDLLSQTLAGSSVSVTVRTDTVHSGSKTGENNGGHTSGNSSGNIGRNNGARATGNDGSDVIANAGSGKELRLNVNLPAVYNIYNALGSYAALREAGIMTESAEKAVSEFQCGFGRMEKLNLGKKGGRMILVKNDAGCNQVLQFLRQVDEPFVLAVYLNNNVSDGVDIGWLEDAEFEVLKDTKMTRLYASGMRTEELYERLRRAGIEESRIVKQKNCAELITELNRSEDAVFIMPTYTGMMETRGEIIRQCGGSEFWNG